MSRFAMDSYMSLCGNEIINKARTHAYIRNGIFPNGFNFKCPGCDGLDQILPCIGDEPPAGGYQLPELDTAPWYDDLVPESRNFAGLYVLSVTMTGPYGRTVTDNIGEGSTLGRLRKKGRNIVVTGWLVGKTCCATQYGLEWLTAALGGDDCGGGDCGGCDLNFLTCCPTIGTGPDDCITANGGIHVRPTPDDEYQRAEDFFGRMHDVGVIDGPNVLECKGTSCGSCGGCGKMLKVEFTLHAGSPYINSLEELVCEMPNFPGCPEPEVCDIKWQVDNEECDVCKEFPDCSEDPNCPLPELPPTRGLLLPTQCGCIPLRQRDIPCSIIPQRDWGTSTLNFEIYAGSDSDKPLRNLAIRVYQNPTEHDCSDSDFFQKCDACATLIINYVPPNGVLRFSGEEREVTIRCGAVTRDAARNISSADEGPFEWPDLSCVPMCAVLTFDCLSTADDATVKIYRVDRKL